MVKTTKEDDILEYIENCIDEFARIYTEGYKDFDDEIDVHFYMYGLLFRMKELVTYKNYNEGEGNEILLHVEWPTKNTTGRFDFVIYSPNTLKDDIPFVAIELKHNKDLNYKKVKTGIIDDLKKLSNEKIIHPMFVYVHKEDLLERDKSFFRENKRKYPQVKMYCITPRLGREEIT